MKDNIINAVNIVIKLTVDKCAETGRMYSDFGVREIYGSDVDSLIEELQQNVSEVLKHE